MLLLLYAHLHSSHSHGSYDTYNLQLSHMYMQLPQSSVAIPLLWSAEQVL